jgi:predicted PurR-regulated permease PerM
MKRDARGHAPLPAEPAAAPAPPSAPAAASVRPVHAARTGLALRVLAVIAVGAVLYAARTACIPVALAGLFALILAGPVEALHRHLRLPRSLGALIVLTLLGSLIGVTVNLLWTPAQSWWNSAPATLRTIERKVRPMALFISRLEQLTHRADEITEIGPPSTLSEPRSAGAPVVVEMPGDSLTAGGHPPIAVALLNRTRDALSGAVTVLMLTLFLLAGGPPMLARMSAALASDRQSAHSLRVIDAVRSELSRYYVGLACINLGLGAVTSGLMLLLHMPNAVLWGVVAGVLNFVPYVGSAITLLLLTAVAFVTYPGMGQVLLVAGGYLALATLEGQVVQPLVIGRRLELNPIIVFLALWFGGWFWGIAGIVMAVPTLVALKVVAAHARHGQPLAEFLSPNVGTLRQLAPSAVAALTPRMSSAPGVAARKSDAEGGARARHAVDLDARVQ